MKIFKGYFKKGRLVTTILQLVMIILSSTIIIAANNSTVKNLLNSLLNIKTYEVRNKADNNFYEKDYKTGALAQEKGRNLNIEINDEGIVLLKNADNKLPLEKGTKISVFGFVSTNLISGGAGSGKSEITDKKLLKKSLESAGFLVNNETQKFYEEISGNVGYVASPMDNDLYGQQFRVGEVDPKKIPENVKNTYQEYNTALYVIGRLNSEGADLPRKLTENSQQVKYDSRDLGKHALELMEMEKDTLTHLNDNFDNVILIINSSAPLELGFLKDNVYNKVKAALVIGGPGENGITSLGRILSGKVSPSGRLIDTYPTKILETPANFNFGKYDYVNVKNTDYNGHFVEYSEGIYVGYNYYETRGFTDGDVWYNQNVVFPFGYGLSYNNFEYEIVGSPGGKITSSAQEIEIKVKVTNKGKLAGKDVVQLYYTSPYTNGGIEKSHVRLAYYVKSGLLKPDESEVLTLKIIADVMSSYDYNDKNNNGFKGYELEAGTYKISLRSNAHTILNNGALEFDYILDEGYKLVNSITHGNNVVNAFDNVSNEMGTILSRSNWIDTMPKGPEANKKLADWAKDELENPKKIKIDINPDAKVFKFGQKLDKYISFAEMRGVAYDDAKWDQFISQIPLQEAIYILGGNAYWIKESAAINKPRSWSLDGPVGFNQPWGGLGYVENLYSVYFASGVLIAQTWNKNLAYEFGKANGELSLHAGEIISGWYAPGVNIRRSQFGGRNYEYFSEDGYVAGSVAAKISKGAQTKGLYTYVKHFAFNNQDTYREGISTWFDEQTGREIYLKAFSIAVKEGNTQAIMTSYNRIGSVWTGMNKGLIKEVLRKEWGFKGMVKTDFITPDARVFTNDQLMLNVGGDTLLSMVELNLVDKKSAMATNDLKNALKNVLHVSINSNLANIVSKDTKVKVFSPFSYWWYATAMIIFVPAGLASVAALVYKGYKIKQEFK